MMWKAIGQSVIGSSHEQTGKPCEDAIHFSILPIDATDEVLICFASDGAGSATHAKQAAELVTQQAVTIVNEWIEQSVTIDETQLLSLAEILYDQLEEQAAVHEVELNEFSCTLLGCILFPQYACFIQVGDGAMVRNDGTGYYTHIFWPHNGEYQNTTSFLIDDRNFPNLHILVVQEPITEVALFTDGLQLLALNTESSTVHQPFINNLMKWLRLAATGEQVAVLDKKLTEYLSGSVINARTDDDKTLFLATRLMQDHAAIQGTP